jgi:hypothetical protein
MRLLILFLLSISLSGCTFYKYTAISAKGDKLNVPMMGMFRAKGDKVDIKFERTVCLGKDCKYDKP